MNEIVGIVKSKEEHGNDTKNQTTNRATMPE